MAVDFRCFHEICHKFGLAGVCFQQNVACVLPLDKLDDVAFVIEVVV